jgi:branched-subunit amino acid transport protein
MSDIAAALGPLWPYLVVILVGFLPSEIWRLLGAVLSRGLDEKAEILVWVRYVATAILAGVVAKLIFAPSGALATVPLWGRIGGIAFGVAMFYLARRSVFAGVLSGVAAVVAIAWWNG